MWPPRRSYGDVPCIGRDARADVLLHVSSMAAADMGSVGVLRFPRGMSGGGNGGEESMDSEVEDASAAVDSVGPGDGGIFFLELLLAVLSAVY